MSHQITIEQIQDMYNRVTLASEVDARKSFSKRLDMNIAGASKITYSLHFNNNLIVSTPFLFVGIDAYNELKHGGSDNV